jgi:lipoprotein LprG
MAGNGSRRGRADRAVRAAAFAIANARTAHLDRGRIGDPPHGHYSGRVTIRSPRSVPSLPASTSMPSRRPRSILAALLGLLGVLLVVGLAGCGGKAGPTAPPLPAAPDLLARSASAMSQVKTVVADVQIDPALTDLPVRAAHGTLTVTGDAMGTATLNQGSDNAELNFVITKGVLYLKGPTGRYQQLPLAMAASIYDPTALLSPDRGIAALLRTATNGVTQAREDVNGVAAYKVNATLDPRLVAGIVPGLTNANSGTVWLDAATSRVLKAQIAVPNPAAGQTATAPVTVALSGFNDPVTVAPPS